MTNKTIGRRIIITTVSLMIVLGLITYLGVRTIKHEALLRHYQVESLGQTRVAQASDMLANLLNQRATRLETVSEFLQTDAKSLETLLDKDIDLENVFVMEGGKLSYPDEKRLLNQKEKNWVQLITPIVHDPSLLYSHLVRDEKNTPSSGWLMMTDNQEPVLIYWVSRDQKTIGFRVSYIKLMSDVINMADFDFGADSLTIRENGRVLYQSSSSLPNAQTAVSYSKALDYPLNAWQIEYSGQKTGTLTIYLWGSFLLLILIFGITLIVFRIYREYTQTIRLASQQVNFVSQVSHELKTPLTNISLYAELLKEELDDDHETGVRYADVVINESKRLSRLIQNILSFTHTPKIHLQTIDLGRLLTDIAQVFTPSFAAKGITLSVSIPQIVTLNADIDKLTQIVSNFLSNAEKYAASGKKVDLSLEKGAGYVDIHVRDYGPGISEREVKKIFQAFYRVRSEITEGVSGTGIGLTIARQLARSMNAEVLASTKTPGMQFTLRFNEPTSMMNENVP